MRTQFTYLLFLVLIWPVSALASDDCATAQTSADVMRCVNQNHERAEASLNDAYKNLSMKKIIYISLLAITIRDSIIT